MEDLSQLSIKEAKRLMSDGEISSTDLVSSCLDKIKKRNKNINAYLEVFDDALARAEEADREIKAGKGRSLTGIPISVKDVMLQRGKIVSAGSKILENYRAVYDSTVVRKLKEAGAVILGRTNMDEFAMGSSTENSAYGPTKNPYDETRVAGGSSGGSAASVSMGGALGSLGSDTGGSIRQPASFCGVVGLKPTYGAVSRYGLIALGSSLDQIGPFGKTVPDVEALFNVIAGHDPKDSTSLEGDEYKPRESAGKPTVGVPARFMEKGVDNDVMRNFNDSLEKLRSAGHKILEISLPNVKYSLPAYYVIMPAEASANLARFDGVKYGLHRSGKDLLGDYIESRSAGFGEEPRRRIILGAYVLSAGYYDAYYGKANTVRSVITEDFKKAFSKVDVIATPTSPTPAFKLGEKSDPLSMYLSDIFTVPSNLTGMPAISVPSGGVERDGRLLPVGVQFIAPHCSESLLFRIGKELHN